MIVIRNVDSTGSECDQKIYCDIACFDHEINWTDSGNPHDSNGSDPHETLNWFAELEQFNVYENEHIKIYISGLICKNFSYVNSRHNSKSIKQLI